MELKKRDALDGNEERILGERPTFDTDADERAVMFIVEAWHDLGADRQLGFGGVGNIPVHAIRRWAEWEGLDRDNTRLLVSVIRKLDNERAEREASKRGLG